MGSQKLTLLGLRAAYAMRLLRVRQGLRETSDLERA